MKINSNRLKVVTLLVMAALFLPAVLMAQDSKTNFSGSWIYNAGKSNAGQTQGQGQRPGQGFGGGDFIANQVGNNLTVERKMRTPDGSESTVISKYTLDGKESTNSSRGGDSKSVATWSSDGKKLTIKTTRTMTRDGESRTITSTELWSLTDPKTLQIETTRPSPDGERKTTAAYDKK
jgi:Tol biopolymer transport system component